MRRLNGSLHASPCANTGSRKTAASPSAREEITAVDPVPLYLVPHTVTVEVKRFGGAISELHVTRGARHMYAVTVVVRE